MERASLFHSLKYFSVYANALSASVVAVRWRLSNKRPSFRRSVCSNLVWTSKSPTDLLHGTTIIRKSVQQSHWPKCTAIVLGIQAFYWVYVDAPQTLFCINGVHFDMQLTESFRASRTAMHYWWPTKTGKQDSSLVLCWSPRGWEFKQAGNKRLPARPACSAQAGVVLLRSLHSFSRKILQSSCAVSVSCSELMEYKWWRW